MERAAAQPQPQPQPQRPSLATAADILSQAGLLREIIAGDVWTLDPSDIDGSDVPFSDLTYDSRTVTTGSLLCCKGRFRPEYLVDAERRGAAAYVSQEDLSGSVHIPGLVVNDVRQALGLLADAWFGYPEKHLTLIGITGTKGKTTTAWFLHSILDSVSGGRCALLSSIANIVDGSTWEESNLTTPESLDTMRMMRRAVDAGMRYMVMEVSSQAYKVHRVDALTFDVGAFLNISPDHISPIEHPTFEDYLYCKRRIVDHSRSLVLGADTAHAALLRQDAAHADIPVTTFALHDGRKDTDADVAAEPLDPTHLSYRIVTRDGDSHDCRLELDGDFNYANAAAAVAIANAAGAVVDGKSIRSMERVRVPGRMERFVDERSQTIGIVDYAHNGVSTTALLDFVDERYGSRHPHITLITGSAGNKAFDRRREIVAAAENRIDRFIFTEDDTDTEPTEDICRQMDESITVPTVAHDIILDRVAAIEKAISDARSHPDRVDVILAIGKGSERWIKRLNEHTPYEGDDVLFSRLLG